MRINGDSVGHAVFDTLVYLPHLSSCRTNLADPSTSQTAWDTRYNNTIELAIIESRRMPLCHCASSPGDELCLLTVTWLTSSVACRCYFFPLSRDVVAISVGIGIWAGRRIRLCLAPSCRSDPALRVGCARNGWDMHLRLRVGGPARPGSGLTRVHTLTTQMPRKADSREADR